ncbi:hypothetical protein BDV96DRAFT_694739 [Lophiotrema nucula]|uniref:FAD-binding domain-containing protein n=1 Tax=Lophiotrema nucula TaxID=690887 RepID=A0A6A5YER9_9PLEO|nr:hypothetical protein BDV96DRAFT_694739 [Lophiotrema nucula]
MEGTKDVIIIGGSLSGLMHAIVLKSLGHNVRILERSSPELLRSQAAGLGTGGELQQLIDEYVKPESPYCTTLGAIEWINKDGEIVGQFGPSRPFYLSTWSIVYRLCKSALLQPAPGSSAKPAIYETGQLVKSVHPSGSKINVEYLDTVSQQHHALEADLVIAADGGNSTIRRSLHPEVAPQYSGYVTWRGAVTESEVSEATRKVLHGRTIMTRMEAGYIMSYYVPAENGSLSPGDCQYIWVWYQMLPEGEEFNSNLTDADSRQHTTTIPRGRMREEIWAKMRARGRKHLSSPFVDLLEHTHDPFLSAIRDCKSPKAVFHDGKLLLVGDAFSLFRPHAGAATSQAARQALSLVKVLKGDMSLEAWETEAIDHAQRIHAFTNAMGSYCFTGVVPPILAALLPTANEAMEQTKD